MKASPSSHPVLGSRERGRYDAVFYLPRIAPLLVQTRDRPTGGAETQIYLLARALVATGARICLVTFAPSEGVVPREIHGVDVIVRKGYPQPGQRLGKLRELIEVWRTLGRVNTPVFVHRTASFETGVVGVVAKLRRRRFIYSSANDVDFDFGDFMRGNRRDVLLYSLGIRLADTIVVQTPEQLEMCRRSFGRSAVMIKSLAEAAPNVSRKPQAFLWIGRTVWYKDPLAYVKLAGAVPEARFRMVLVPGHDGDQLGDEVAEAAAKEPNLELVSPRPRSELLSLYDTAVAIVNTSHHEGMPNVFLEGWARGVPALSLRCDPSRTLTDERLGFWAGGSLDRMAGQARQLWAARGELSDFSSRSRGYVEREHGPGVVETWRSVLGVGDQPVGLPEPHPAS